jgi:DNA (cytosine-5)-methyltransferase 1
MKIISLFSGAGGLDLGFKQAGFKTIWANEFDKNVCPTYKKNFKDVHLDTRSITKVEKSDLPKDITGVIGGPPCQSWSAAGAQRGINDPRGKLFYEYLRIIRIVHPKFFVAENVSGIIQKKNKDTFNNIVSQLEDLGYNVRWALLNAANYGVPQDRKRVFIVGYSWELKMNYEFPSPLEKKITLREAIGDLEKSKRQVKNHESIKGSYSPLFLSRNRVRGWDQQSFTILATDRHIPFHPSCPKMVNVGKDKMELCKGAKYKRLTVRECARIQTFPDSYDFLYKNIRTGYKMVGNAVPVNLAYQIAKKIAKDLEINNKSQKKM